MTLEQKIGKLVEALAPFAAMDREDCDLREQASRRGTGYDATTIFSEDFRRAAKTLKEVEL